MAPLRMICAGVRDQDGWGSSHGESANRGSDCSGSTLPFCAGTGPVFHNQTPSIWMMDVHLVLSISWHSIAR